MVTRNSLASVRHGALAAALCAAVPADAGHEVPYYPSFYPQEIRIEPLDPQAAGRDVAVTYWMNALQGIDEARPLFITLNPPVEPDPAKTFRRFSYAHPQYDAAALAAQRRLPAIQGRNRTYFCGAWTGYGFHEDGLSSGLDVAERLGSAAPWLTSAFAEAAE